MDKLLLPWQGATVMDHVVRAWADSGVSGVVAIVRRDNVALQEVCRRWTAVDLVVPAGDPKDMKESVQIGLRHLDSHYHPREQDRWMLAPADLPTLKSGLIDRLIEASDHAEKIVAPRFGDRHGHPVSFPWTMMPLAMRLGPQEGIDQLVKHHPVHWIDLPPVDFPQDIDTPEDYQRAVNQRFGAS